MNPSVLAFVTVVQLLNSFSEAQTLKGDRLFRESTAGKQDRLVTPAAPIPDSEGISRARVVIMKIGKKCSLCLNPGDNGAICSAAALECEHARAFSQLDSVLINNVPKHQGFAPLAYICERMRYAYNDMSQKGSTQTESFRALDRLDRQICPENLRYQPEKALPPAPRQPWPSHPADATS